MPETDTDLLEKVVGLCKRRGFIFQSAEIYGGFRSTYDYGPLGVNMLRNVKNAWWRSMVQLRQEVVGLDASILSSPKIWAASGHLDNFSDPMVDCRNCKERMRADHLEPAADGRGTLRARLVQTAQHHDRAAGHRQHGAAVKAAALALRA